MRSYELVLVVRPSVKDADRKTLLETVKGWMKDVKVVKEDDWGQKPLAYAIKKEEAGYFYVLQLESETGIETDVEQRILRHEDIIRHLLVRTK